ncbi:MAG: cytochrome P450 [Pseudomonadota bacterium]
MLEIGSSDSDDKYLDQLDTDPYAIFDALRPKGAVHWIAPLKLWYVINHEQVSAILHDTADFVSGTSGSPVYDTFGTQMLSVDGQEQIRYRSAFRAAFAKRHVREKLTDEIHASVDTLISSFEQDGSTDLRRSFASRLPIQTILHVFGLSQELEKQFRSWYDSFEAALGNFERKPDIRIRAKNDVEDFHTFMQNEILRVRGTQNAGLLASVVNDDSKSTLTDEEIRKNTLIILFGGISTVEALILNTMYAVLSFAGIRSAVIDDFDRLPSIIEESVRWLSPVQSATRHAARDIEIAGTKIKKGDTVNCMLGAANRDPKVFFDPADFKLDRPNIKQHIGFATGPHVCLGNHLARLQGEIAIKRLLKRLPDVRLTDPEKITIKGYEFRQPNRLDLSWRC